MRLRPYQQQAVDAIFEAWRTCKSTLVVMPTGSGKTIVLASVVKHRPKGRAMLIAHREELIWQGASKIHAVTGVRPDIEMAEMRARSGLFDSADVVVSSVQTQNSGARGLGRMSRFDPMDFSLLIVDEAHHSTAASYRRVISHFRQNPKLCILGMTATPDRADEEAMGQVFESVAYDYELPAAIDDGWLVPIRQRAVIVDGLDYSSIRTTAGDLHGADLDRVLQYESNLLGISDATIRLSENRKTLVFAVSIEHAKRLAEIFNRYKPGSARMVCGGTPAHERRAIFADYAARKFQFLCNVGVATEGFDDCGIEVVAIARPTKSRALYAQMVGRGTRPLPGVVDIEDIESAESSEQFRRSAIAASPKPCVEILDFVGNSGSHKLITTADILGGNYSERAVEYAHKKAQSAGGAPVDVRQALEEAEEELAREKARQDEIARRAGLRAKANFSTQEVDPFGILEIRPRRERGWDIGRQPSEKMVALLERQGIQTGHLTFAQAGQLIQEITRRWDKKECSFKQAKLLQKYGYQSKGITFDQARHMIDELARKGWRRPDAKPVTVY